MKLPYEKMEELMKANPNMTLRRMAKIIEEDAEELFFFFALYRLAAEAQDHVRRGSMSVANAYCMASHLNHLDQRKILDDAVNLSKKAFADIVTSMGISAP